MKKPWLVITIHLFSIVGLLLMPAEVFTLGAEVPPEYPEKEAEQSSVQENRLVFAKDSYLENLRRNGTLCLKLNDCLCLALKQNREIHLMHQTLVQADADIARARSAMLPFLGLETSYTRMDEALEFSIPPVSATFIDQDIYKGGVIIRQPIFAGGRLAAALKAAQSSRDANFQDKQAVEQEIVLQVTRAYHTSQVAKAFNKVAEESLHLLETHAHDVDILVREGANPELDLLRTRTEVAHARKMLNAAQNAVDLALSSLKNLLTIDLDEPLALAESLSRPRGPKQDLSELTRMALSRRPESSSLGFRIDAAKKGLQMAKGEYWPTVALEARYEYMEGDFRDLEGGDHWTVGIGARMPLWNWGETASKVKKAESLLNQANIQYEKTKDQIRLQVREAFLNLGKAGKNIMAAESGLETAGEAYRLARAGYREGAITNTEVLDARIALSRAEANHAQALFEYNLALANLNRAVGMGFAPHTEEKTK